jgi:hypothetical protein
MRSNAVGGGGNSLAWVVAIMMPLHACSRGWGSLMTHSAGSVTTQRKAFTYVMASMMVNLIFKIGHGNFAIH